MALATVMFGIGLAVGREVSTPREVLGVAIYTAVVGVVAWGIVQLTFKAEGWIGG